MGRKHVCFRRFRPRASHTSGAGRGTAPRRVVFLVLAAQPIVLIRSYGPVPLAAGSANRGANRALTRALLGGGGAKRPPVRFLA